MYSVRIETLESQWAILPGGALNLSAANKSSPRIFSDQSQAWEFYSSKTNTTGKYVQEDNLEIKFSRPSK